MGASAEQVQSIFFGGGTPSLFSPAAIGEIVASIRTRLTLELTAEITLEANPGTIERGRFAEYRAAGVNRVSLGGQSFNEQHLKLLGRIHSSRETRDAAAGAARRGARELQYRSDVRTAAASRWRRAR